MGLAHGIHVALHCGNFLPASVSLHGTSPWHPRGPSLRQLLSCKREPPWDKPMASLRTTSPWQRLGDVRFFPADFRRWGFVLRLLLAEDHIHTMRFSIVGQRDLAIGLK